MQPQIMRSKTYKCHEKRDDVDDGQCPACLEHRTSLVHVDAKACATAIASVIAEWAQIDINVSRGEVRAVGAGNASEFHHACDQSAHECKIDERDKDGVVSSAKIADQCEECPGQCEY